MNILLHYLDQTPVKPILPAWLRTLCQADVCRRLAIYQGHHVDTFRKIDDTSLQVAKLLTLEDEIHIPIEEIGEYLGKKYVQAHRNLDEHKAAQIKLELESGKSVKAILQPSVAEQKHFFDILNFEQGPHVWESDYLHTIPQLFEILQTNDCLLDYSKYHGGTFLDVTDQSMRLMTLHGKTGYTYLAKELAYLITNADAYDMVIIQHIDEDNNPFRYMRTIFEMLGIRTIFLTSGRIKIEGTPQSSRHGGWEPYTIKRILEKLQHYAVEDIRVGFRLYFLGHKDSDRFTFNYNQLVEQIIFAEKVRMFIDTIPHAVLTASANCTRNTTKAGFLLNKFREPTILQEPSKVARNYSEVFALTRKALQNNDDSIFFESLHTLLVIKEVLGGE